MCDYYVSLNDEFVFVLQLECCLCVRQAFWWSRCVLLWFLNDYRESLWRTQTHSSVFSVALLVHNIISISLCCDMRKNRLTWLVETCQVTNRFVATDTTLFFSCNNFISNRFCNFVPQKQHVTDSVYFLSHWLMLSQKIHHIWLVREQKCFRLRLDLCRLKFLTTRVTSVSVNGCCSKPQHNCASSLICASIKCLTFVIMAHFDYLKCMLSRYNRIMCSQVVSKRFSFTFTYLCIYILQVYIIYVGSADTNCLIGFLSICSSVLRLGGCCCFGWRRHENGRDRKTVCALSRAGPSHRVHHVWISVEWGYLKSLGWIEPYFLLPACWEDPHCIPGYMELICIILSIR